MTFLRNLAVNKDIKSKRKICRQNESFVNTSRKLLENTDETFPVVRYFTWKLELVSNILSVLVASVFTSYLQKGQFKLLSLKIF